MKGLNLRVVLLLLGILSVSLFISMQQIKEGFGVMGSPTASNLTDSITESTTPVIPPAPTAPPAPVTPASTAPPAPVTPASTAPPVPVTPASTAPPAPTSQITPQETGSSHMAHSTSPAQVITIAPPNTFNPEKFAKGLSAIATMLIDSVQGMGDQQPFTTLYSAYP